MIFSERDCFKTNKLCWFCDKDGIKSYMFGKRNLRKFITCPKCGISTIDEIASPISAKRTEN